MITLDKRIKPNKKPLDCFDTELAKSYVGKECYFAFNVSEFSDLSKTHKMVLTGFQSSEQPFVAKDKIINTDDEYVYSFCLPCEWVDDVESYHELSERVKKLEDTVAKLLERFETTERRASTLSSLVSRDPYANCSSEYIKMVLK
jgi:hypothetical protein